MAFFFDRFVGEIVEKSAYCSDCCVCEEDDYCVSGKS